MKNEKIQETDLNRKLDLVLETGALLMESGADTSRIRRTMNRVAGFLGLPLDNLQIYVMFSLLLVYFNDEERSYTKMRRISKHGVNLDAIREVSHLSWEDLRKDYTEEEFRQHLEAIRTRKSNYKPWSVAVGGGLACGGFCIQFGSDWTAFVYTAIAACLGLRLRAFLNKKGSNPYIGIGVVAMVSTLIAWLFGLLSTQFAATYPTWAFLQSDTPWHPLLSCALFIVPGVPLINFVSDMLTGNTQVGLTRAANTMMILTAMAFGIAFAIQVCGIDSFVHDMSITPHHSYLTYITAAAISSVGFSMIFNVPPRLMGFIALGGIIAICTRNLVSLGASTGNFGLDLGPVIGSFFGSAVISIICCALVHRLHTPHQCLSIPSVIPMVPGVLMYRALFAFIDMHGVVGEVTVAMNNAIRASLIILCIALGVAIPNIFFRRMINPLREQKMIDMIVKRKQQNAKESAG